jgi:glycosyltransferase involved in cell wall biosynthesis
MKIDLILVFYNNEKVIDFVVDSIKNISYIFDKIILVNNGSVDNTKILLSNNFKNKKKYKLINLEKNVHLGGAIKAGIFESRANTVGWSHGDVLIMKKDYERFVRKIKEVAFKNDTALIKGVRINRKDIIDKLFSLCSGLYASMLYRKPIYDISGIPVFFINFKNKNIFVNAPNDYTFHFFSYFFCIYNEIKVFRVRVSLINPPILSSNWRRNSSGYLKIILMWIRAFFFYKKNLSLFEREE